MMWPIHDFTLRIVALGLDVRIERTSTWRIDHDSHRSDASCISVLTDAQQHRLPQHWQAANNWRTYVHAEYMLKGELPEARNSLLGRAANLSPSDLLEFLAFRGKPASAASSAPLRALWLIPWPGWRWPSASPKARDVLPRCGAAAAAHRTSRPCWPVLPAPRRCRAPSDDAPIAASSSFSGNGYSCSTKTIAVESVFPLLALLAQFVADLSRAEQDARGIADFRVRQHGQKALVGEIFDRRRRVRMPQHALRRKDDQRLAPVAQRLPPQQVKILRRIRRLADLEIVPRRELQKAFDAGAGMLRPLAFIAVGQQQHHARRAVPICLRRR